MQRGEFCKQFAGKFSYPCPQRPDPRAFFLFFLKIADAREGIFPRRGVGCKKIFRRGAILFDLQAKIIYNVSAS